MPMQSLHLHTIFRRLRLACGLETREHIAICIYGSTCATSNDVNRLVESSLRLSTVGLLVNPQAQGGDEIWDVKRVKLVL